MRRGGGDGATVGGAVMVRMVRVGREVVRVGGRRVGEGGGGSVAVIMVRVGREGTVWGAISVSEGRVGQANASTKNFPMRITEESNIRLQIDVCNFDYKIRFLRISSTVWYYKLLKTSLQFS